MQRNLLAHDIEAIPGLTRDLGTSSPVSKETIYSLDAVALESGGLRWGAMCCRIEGYRVYGYGISAGVLIAVPVYGKGSCNIWRFMLCRTFMCCNCLAAFISRALTGPGLVTFVQSTILFRLLWQWRHR